jgi:hypothetical protein
MGAKFNVHEVTLGKDNETDEGQFTVRLPDGRKIGLFSSGSVTVYVPHGDTPGCGYEAVEIETPRTMDDIAEHCTRDDFDAYGNFHVTAHHRH